MSRCLTVHRHMEVAAIHAKKARTALAADDADAILPPSPATAPVAAGDATDPAAITLKLFQTDSSNTLPCVHALIKAHYHSMRSLRHVLVPPPPALPLQFEGLTSQQVEQLTGPIRDVCESLTTRDCTLSHAISLLVLTWRCSFDGASHIFQRPPHGVGCVLREFVPRRDHDDGHLLYAATCRDSSARPSVHVGRVPRLVRRGALESVLDRGRQQHRRRRPPRALGSPVP
ncbi:hypothetical protein, variant 7 [Aphanomyces astaci]|uniref:Uncharacterized protein n=1 Tax=Aphanomyces astaci TaxID=112090 RepID=W4H0U6_APHAT|nr:hypothetical protein, variant 6 [Aphanomyces astaci]XP_009825541.1 hypothetical protein, variant 7 [Aphanomyces astaci]ETV85522.1 hypothetical protein, variant 6 [Aphanomyces astaci]ETV85523.1 hypothetical protein, variant 7 [Aphanomyces astaci]|eukprot:XP_009825540.1 hypothetical protein, variant 6 [Aphanomyces astaci]